MSTTPTGLVIHVCLISDQLLPNLIPVLQDRPAHVCLVVNLRMTEQAERLSAILRMHDIPSLVRRDAPDSGLPRIHRYAEAVLATIDNTLPNHRIVLNATGGTKLMSLGFIDIFRESPRVAGIFYTDTAHDQLEMLHRSELGAVRAIAPNLMDINHYLAVQGMIPKSIDSADTAWVQRTEERGSLSDYLATHQSPEMRDLIGDLNRCVISALDSSGIRLQAPDQRLLAGKLAGAKRVTLPLAWHEPLGMIRDVGLIGWDNGIEIRFTSADAAGFLGGKWLEEYTWRVVQSLNPQHLAAGVHGEWLATTGKRPSNEIDVLAVHRNRMLVIECKTGKFGKYGQKDQDLVNKLQVLAENAGGAFGRGLLVSYNELTAEARGRISAMRQIDRIEGGNLREQITHYVRRWMGDAITPETPITGDDAS